MMSFIDKTHYLLVLRVAIMLHLRGDVIYLLSKDHAWGSDRRWTEGGTFPAGNCLMYSCTRGWGRKSPCSLFNDIIYISHILLKNFPLVFYRLIHSREQVQIEHQVFLGCFSLYFFPLEISLPNWNFLFLALFKTDLIMKTTMFFKEDISDS